MRLIIFLYVCINYFVTFLQLPQFGVHNLPLMLPFVLIVIALVGLVGLFVWRSKHASSAPPAPVAASNHKSVRSFNYGPAPVAPAPNEDARPNEQAQAQVATTAPVVAAAPATPATPAAPAAQVAVVAKQPVAPAAAVSALDMLGDDELPAPKSAAPAAPDAGSDEAEPDRSLFYNPFTAPAPTANDEANRLAEVELRKQQRAARRAGAGAQKEALTTLYKTE